MQPPHRDEDKEGYVTICLSETDYSGALPESTELLADGAWASRRSRGDSLTRIVSDLNPMLRGWFAYFRHAHLWTFPRVDGFVRRRLRALLRKQQKRPGAGRYQSDHLRWPNAFFATAGLVTMIKARTLASQSR